jgi:hypothetical protein
LHEYLLRDSRVRTAAAVAYLFKMDPVQVLSGGSFEFAVRQAAARYIDDLMEEARAKS